MREPSLGGVEAKRLFISAWVNQGNGTRLPANLSKQDKSISALMLTAFNAMLTREDKVLMNRPEGAESSATAWRIAREVERMVVVMCLELYQKAGKKVPQSLMPRRKRNLRAMGGLRMPCGGELLKLKVSSMEVAGARHRPRRSRWRRGQGASRGEAAGRR